jgi:zinc transport system ATP-binding protein
MAFLEIKNLKIYYGKAVALEHISFSLEKGETLAVIGPNGSGKTTLFKSILGALPYEGEIIKAENLKIGYVPQKLDLERDPPLTVEEFFDLQKHTDLGSGGISDGHSVAEMLKMVDLSDNYLIKRIGELSSGELQRILIAWALIGHPDLLLFDEPTASVDMAGQETVYELLHKLQAEHNLTLILISHDLTVVYKYAPKVLCLNKTQTCWGPPSEVLTPKELEKLYGGERKFYQHNH